MKNKKYISLIPLAAISTLALGVALVAAPAFAEDTNVTANAGLHVGAGLGWQHGKAGAPGTMRMRPGVFGTVTAVSGNTITVTTKVGPNGTPAAATYTVDATNATVMKNNATSTVSSIAVGDMIAVQGTVTGTSVVATSIHDGIPMKGPRNPGGPEAAPLITGNGQPVVAGKVTAVSGSTITITNNSNVTYTIDATNAKIQRGNALSTVSSVAVGDSVVVQGAISGNSVTASSVIDQAAQANGNVNGKGDDHKGFFGSIGSFFGHLFGF